MGCLLLLACSVVEAGGLVLGLHLCDLWFLLCCFEIDLLVWLYGCELCSLILVCVLDSAGW